MRAALLLALLAAPAASPVWAACPGDTVFSCPIGKKTVEICHAKGLLTYTFGRRAGRVCGRAHIAWRPGATAGHTISMPPSSSSDWPVMPRLSSEPR